jgi:hypothetical protein
MTFVVALRAAAAAVAVALVTAPAQQPERPIVVIVHGRGHLDGDSAALRRQWKRDLDSAIVPTGHRLSDADVRLAWYADILEPSGSEACPRTDNDSLGIGAFTSFIGALAAALPREESREARGLIGDLVWVVDDARRCAAERRVGSVIERAVAEKRPVIVVGYSLGSLVSYGYLKARTPRIGEPAIHLVTLGSPLGNPMVRELLGQGTDSLRRPRSVRSWQNVYDPDDPFAARVSDASTGDAAEDRATESDATRDPHDIERYLRDRAMAAVLKKLFSR